MLLSLLVWLVSYIVSIFLFCSGFFPSKNVLSGDAQFRFEPEYQLNSQPVFDKLVIVVIDALRSDFMFEQGHSQFSFVHDMLNSGNAWGFTAFSNPPTVTLPRLKGITTGSTPNFLDAILNVAEGDSSSNLNDQDSWPMQFFNKGKKIRFFGDDTWLKLFPLKIFSEYEGTNSFFVSDFEQVDLNVTRHLDKQFKEQHDWDVLILHYLGLDHIGHKGGANSKFLPPKQLEMDAIIKRIYENIDDNENMLLCVMGDHGMNDVGNHGGSSAGETSAAIALISKKLQKLQKPLNQQNVNLPIAPQEMEPTAEKNYQFLTSIQQVDIVPTISALFNVPIPKNSVGVLIPDLLRLLDPKQLKIKLKENFKQLVDVTNEKDNEFLFNSIDFTEYDVDDLIEIMRDIQGGLMRSATNYNMNFLVIGASMLVFITISVALFYRSFFFSFTASSILTLSTSLLIGFSSFGSSFVEEEHQIWWWIITGLITVSIIKKSNEKFLHFIIFLSVRIIRGWNNSGQKFVNENTISNMLKVDYQNFQWYINILTLLVITMKYSMDNFLPFMVSFLLATLCLMYKVCWALVNQEHVPEQIEKIVYDMCVLLIGDDDSLGKDIFNITLIPLAQLFFYCILVVLIGRFTTNIFSKKLGNPIEDFKKTIVFLLIFQTPSSNIGMYLVYELLQYSINSMVSKYHKNDTQLISVISLILQYFTFYQSGGTNSIATIDLSNAYNGVSENYNIYFVGWMMSVSNYAPAIYWSMLPWTTLYNGMATSKSKWWIFAQNKLPVLLFNCIAGCFLLISCIILRYHLFIWSVFSPKLCYYAMWNIFMNCIIGWILELLAIMTI